MASDTASRATAPARLAAPHVSTRFSPAHWETKMSRGGSMAAAPTSWIENGSMVAAIQGIRNALR